MYYREREAGTGEHRGGEGGAGRRWNRSRRGGLLHLPLQQCNVADVANLGEVEATGSRSGLLLSLFHRRQVALDLLIRKS